MIEAQENGTSCSDLFGSDEALEADLPPYYHPGPDSDEIKELSFDFEGAGNLKSPSTGHQHHLVLRFDDADHLTETWTWREADKDIPMLFHFTRKKY